MALPLRGREPRLSGKILEAFVKSSFDNRQPEFLPEGVLTQLVKRKVVQREFLRSTRLDITHIQELVDFVLNNGKKIFAVSVMSNLSGQDLQDAIQLLKDAGISDKSLPISEAYFRSKTGVHPITPGSEQGSATEFGNTNHQQLGNDHIDIDDDDDEDGDYIFTDEFGDLQEIWTDVRINEFCTKQWSFLAPVFSLANHNHDLAEFSILPFTRRYPHTVSGAFGQVTKYEIHKHHLVSGATVSCLPV